MFLSLQKLHLPFEFKKEKVTVIENFLINRFSPIPDYDNLLIQKGIELVKGYKGQINAKCLSESLYTSPKTLERKFAKYLGKTTKQLISLFRFQEVLRDFSCVDERSLTDHAVKNGYFDQSHFIHDFKSHTGYTPREFRAKYPDFGIQGEGR